MSWLVSTHMPAHTSTLKHWSRLSLPKLIRLHLTLSPWIEGWRGKQGKRHGHKRRKKKKKRRKEASSLCPIHLSHVISRLLNLICLQRCWRFEPRCFYSFTYKVRLTHRDPFKTFLITIFKSHIKAISYTHTACVTHLKIKWKYNQSCRIYVSLHG